MMEGLLGTYAPSGSTKTKRPTCTAVPVPSGQPPVLPKASADGTATPLVNADVSTARIRSHASRIQPPEFRRSGYAFHATTCNAGRGMSRRGTPLRAGYS